MALGVVKLAHTLVWAFVAMAILVSAARELGSHATKLVFHVPMNTGHDARTEVASAVRHYFTYRAWHTGEQLRALLTKGVTSLAIGLLFLFVCLSTRQLIDVLGGGGANEILSEGLLILGWVAMWRPVEIFLYDWWPEFGKRQLLLRIAGMAVEVRSAERHDAVETEEPTANKRRLEDMRPVTAT